MSPFFDPIAILAILVAVTIHEWSHGYVAHRLGDYTPKAAGRLTLNPIAHLDPLGSLLFLFVGFGWAKPVPVNPASFRHPRRDTGLVALAGPVSNLLLASLAFVGLLALEWNVGGGSWVSLIDARDGGNIVVQFLTKFCRMSLIINLSLMAFNLLPVAPLDGSKVVDSLIPYKLDDFWREAMARGPMILLGIIVLEMLFNVPILSLWVHTIVDWTLTGMIAIASVFL